MSNIKIDNQVQQIMNKIIKKLNKLNNSNYSMQQNKTKPEPKLDLTLGFFTGLLGLIFVVGLIANLLVIIVYIFDTQSKKQKKYFFINLSISDIAVLLVCVPITITDLYSPEEWLYGWVFCKYFFFLVRFYHLSKLDLNAYFELIMNK